MYSRPRRRTRLHCAHRGFTEGWTFITAVSSFLSGHWSPVRRVAERFALGGDHMVNTPRRPGPPEEYEFGGRAYGRICAQALHVLHPPLRGKRYSGGFPEQCQKAGSCPYFPSTTWPALERSCTAAPSENFCLPCTRIAFPLFEHGLLGVARIRSVGCLPEYVRNRITRR